MNIHECYRRRTDHTLTSEEPPAREQATWSAFATQGDPSITAGTASTSSAPGLRWVRPTDLLTTTGSDAIRRSIASQARTTRYVRRAPGRAAANLSRTLIRSAVTARAAISPTVPTTPGVEL